MSWSPDHIWAFWVMWPLWTSDTYNNLPIIQWISEDGFPLLAGTIWYGIKKFLTLAEWDNDEQVLFKLQQIWFFVVIKKEEKMKIEDPVITGPVLPKAILRLSNSNKSESGKRFARNWHSFDVATNQPVNPFMCSVIEGLSKVIQVEIFIWEGFFLPKNKARDLCLRGLFTISYILSKADMHLKRRVTFSIVTFTGKVVIFTSDLSADQLFFCSVCSRSYVFTVTKQRRILACFYFLTEALLIII